jgi:tRNA nucleotidyltransferase/poly(A) polymerase
VGAKFGVVVVLGPDTQVEVATFRCDLAYKDGRRPEGVVYSDAEHDALRRDFTINGMFYDPFENKVIDYVGGEVDLRRKVIRSIGQARLRFGEDHLRMLRAIRFACSFGFTLEDSTASAIADHAGDIKRISVERIADELLKILQSSGRARGISLAGELGLLKVILPEVDYSCAAGRLARLKGASALTGLACLLYGLDQTYQPKQSGERARVIARRLKLPNELVDQVAWLSETVRALVAQQANIEQISLAQLKRMLTRGIFRELIWLYSTVGPDKAVGQLRSRCEQIDPEAVSPTPLINGKDLQQMGLRSGPRMGQCLADVYEAQLNEQVKTKAQARKFVRDWL